MILIPANMKPTPITNQGMVSCNRNVSGESCCAWPWGSDGGDRSGPSRMLPVVETLGRSSAMEFEAFCLIKQVICNFGIVLTRDALFRASTTQKRQGSIEG